MLVNGKYWESVENDNVSELTNQFTMLIKDIDIRKYYQEWSLERVEDF